MATEYFSTGRLGVTGGAAFYYSVYLNSGTSLQATINWQDSQNKDIATSATGWVSAGETASVDGYAPGNASQAVVTIAVNHDQYQTSEFSGANFGQTLPQYTTVTEGGLPQPSSVSLSTPSYTYPPTLVGGPPVTSSTLTSRYTDDHQNSWQTPDGNFTVGQYAQGTAWPSVPGTRSLALLPGTAGTTAVPINVGVTFRSPAVAPQAQYLIFRYSTDSNYWRASATQLQKKVNGNVAVVGTFSTPFSVNDRMVVSLSGNAINVYRNGGNLVLGPVSDSFNATAILHGMGVE